MADPTPATHSPPPFLWIDSDPALSDACTYWQSLTAIGVDTEFVRTRTYFAKLGLIQVGAGEQCWLIDPLKISNWSAFVAVLADPDTTKIIHSGSEDIEIFQRLGDAPLAGFFDTQKAAALCGLGSSLSYQALVMELCNTVVEKDVTRSDWVARPLSDAQLRYAALDVAHLDVLLADLTQRLNQLERMAWLVEDCDELIARVSIDEQLAQQFQRFKGVWRLNGPQRSALASLIQWRELTARKKDRPRSHVLTDNDLLTLARDMPADRDALLGLQLEHARSVSRQVPVLLEHLKNAGEEQSHPPAQPEPLDRSAKQLVGNLRGKISDQAEALGIAPEVLCGKRELLHLLQTGKPSRKLAGWRFAMLKPFIEEHLPS
ncbi:MAG: ribonuclease D [Lysobacterales bacterium]